MWRWWIIIADSPEIQSLGAGATLTDTATVEVSDGQAIASATITIIIEGTNDDPTGDDDTGEVIVGSDKPVTGSVNPMDVDTGDTHTFEVGHTPSYGTLTVDDEGTWRYELDNDHPTVREV